LIHVSNSIDLKIDINNESIIQIKKNDLNQNILNTNKVKGVNLGNNQRYTQQEKDNWFNLSNLINNIEKELKGENTVEVTENLTSQKNNISYVKKVSNPINEEKIVTLTITTLIGGIEETYIVNAVTVLDSLEMIKTVLEEQLKVSFNEIEFKNKGDRNWERGMSWTKGILGPLKRHLAAIEKGIDYDIDKNCPTCQRSTKDNWICENHSGELHINHIQANAHILSAYYKIYPQGDDRNNPLVPNYKIGLDIDEVICDWVGDWTKYRSLDIPSSWYFDRGMMEEFKKMEKENRLDEFYLKLKPKYKGEDLPFEPHCYITSRPVSSEVSEKWLDQCGFPARPVFTTTKERTKVVIAKEQGIDIFVDDGYHNFMALNAAGICCYLYDAPHNQRYDVGHKRIYSLMDLPF